MSGETEKQVSGWTVDTLKELMDTQVAAVREEMRANKGLLQAENANTATALVVARTEMERRLEGLNELRKEVTKDREQFVKLDVYVPAHEELRRQRVADNDKAITLGAQVQADREDIAALKSSQMWLTRLIAGALILGIIGYLFQRIAA